MADAPNLQNPTLGTVKLKNNTNSTTAVKVNVQEADGSLNTRDKEIFTENSAGAISGFAITNNGNGTVNIASGYALLRATNNENGILQKYLIPAVTNLALTDNVNNYVIVQYNAGSPNIVVVTDTNLITTTNNTLIYVVARYGTTVNYLYAGEQNVDSNGKLRRRFLNVEPIKRAAGAVIGFTNRTINTTDGLFYGGLTPYTTPLLGATFTNAYNNGSVWTRQTAQTQVNNTQYNLNGVLTAMTNGRFRTDFVYIMVNNPSVLYTVMGTSQTNSLANARLVTMPSSLPVELQRLGVLVGRLIIGTNNAAITEVSSAYEITFNASTVINHNDTGNIQGGAVGDYQHVTTAEKTTWNGKMDKSVYDTTNSGIVDSAEGVVRLVSAQEAISKGDPVYVSTTGDPTFVMRARADNAAKMPAFAIAQENIASGATGKVTVNGSIRNLNTGSFTLGKNLYVGLTGGLTSTKPTTNAQPIGITVRSGGSDGVIAVEPQAILETIVVDQTIIDGSTNAVSGNAVFDGLATKENKLDVSNYGAVGNGIADDTSSIQAMINDVGYFKLKKGIYKITNSLTIPNTAIAFDKIYGGINISDSQLLCVGMSGKPAIKLATNSQLARLNFENFKISGDCENAINLTTSTNVYNTTFSNLTLESNGDCLVMRNDFSCKLTNVQVSSINGHGFNVDGLSAVNFDNCYAHNVGATKAGYRIKGSSVLIGCNGIDSGGTWGWFGATVADDGYDSTANISLIGCNIEDYDIRAIYCSYQSDLHISSSYFISKITGTYSEDIKFATTNNTVVLKNNTQTTKGSTYTSASRIVTNGFVGFISSNNDVFDDYYDIPAGIVYKIPLETLSLVAYGINAYKVPFFDCDRNYGFNLQKPINWTQNNANFNAQGQTVLYTNNTILTSYDSATGGVEGQHLSILIKDNFTRINHLNAGAGRFKLSKTSNVTCVSGEIYNFVYDGIQWVEYSYTNAYLPLTGGVVTGNIEALPATLSNQVPTWGQVQGLATSGTYTPTLTNLTNISSLVLSSAVYTVIGNIVTVRVEGSFDPITASTITQFSITLPVIMSNASQVSLGSGSAGSFDFLPVLVSKNTTSLVIAYLKSSTDISINPFSVTFTYQK